MQDLARLAAYDLPVLTSRRGIIQGLLGLSAVFALLFAATGNAHLGDVVVVGLGASLFIAATAPFLKLGGPIARLVVPAPIYLPLFLAAALESSVSMALLLAALGLEVLVFCFLFLQAGQAKLTVRGLQRHRLLTTSYSFDEMESVKRFSSRPGRLLRQIGFGSTSVEIVLFSSRHIRLNVAAAEVDDFIEKVESEIDPTASYEMFFFAATEETAEEGVEAKPAARRGRRPKQPASPEQEAPRIRSARR